MSRYGIGGMVVGVCCVLCMACWVGCGKLWGKCGMYSVKLETLYT